MPNTLSDWIAELSSALGVDPAVLDQDLILDVARDAAHGVARPAAPLTTFLVGYAAGRSVGGGSAGGGSAGGGSAVAEAAATAQRLATAREGRGACQARPGACQARPGA